MRKKLTPALVKDPLADREVRADFDRAVAEGIDRIIVFDEAMPKFGLVISTKTKTCSFGFQYREKRTHKSRRKIWAVRIDGSRTGLTLAQAHSEARKLAGDVERGADPVKQLREERRKQEGALATTLKAICEDHLIRECGMKRDGGGKATFSGKLRSAKQRLKVFERLVYPDKIGACQIHGIKRSQFVKLLDKVEDERGPRMAHVLGAYLSRVCSWYARRDDSYSSPFVRGMAARVRPKERAGKRVLDDQEIRDLWAALDAGSKDIPDCFARLVRTLLLTATRRDEAARTSWAEIEHLRHDDCRGDVLTIPGSRMKGKLDHAVPLTPAVLDLISGRPKDAKTRPFVFSTTGGTKPFSGYSKAKAALDREIAKLRERDGRDSMPAWRLHDLRRTSKTLMIRAGVRPDISERVLGHAIPGVEGVYDRWGYLPEKSDALTQLAALIDRIVTPPADNIVPMKQAG
jgi:integrase